MKKQKWPYKTYGPDEVNAWQKITDKILAYTLLPFIPRFISPNQISSLRIASLPFIYYLLANQNYRDGLILFFIAALTDALDGAMARTRDRVTNLGKMLDAIADRGLILLVAFIFIPELFGWPLLIYMLILESLNASMAYIAKKRLGKNPNANWAGKIKMLVQSIAFIMIFIGILSEVQTWTNYAGSLLYFSLIFTFLQSFLYPQKKKSVRKQSYAS